MKKEDIEHLGALARIQLTDEEIEVLTEDVTDILGFVSEVDTIAGAEKEKKVGVLHNVVRVDEESHEPGEYTEAILAAAPDRKGKYVQVKKILGGE